MITVNEKQRPWGKWYWGDWRKDARLRRCCYASRGLWADMLSLMGGECDRFGYLIMGGQPLGVTDLAGLLGGSVREVKKLLDELAGKWVFSRIGDEDLPEDIQRIVATDLPVGTIFSRRMLRDKAKEELDRANGKGGGNPRLKAEHHKTENRDNGGVNPGDKAQILEARSQKPEKEPSLRSDAREPKLELELTPFKPRAKSGEPPGFAEFYAKYPRREAQPDAVKAYADALKRATAEQIMAGVERYAAAMAGKERKYVKLPAGWLRSDRWLDDAPSEAALPFTAAAPPQSADDRWRRKLKLYAEKRVWLGPDGSPPLERDGTPHPDCCVPRHLLAEFGFLAKPKASGVAA